jgi:hypothetical protein
VGIVVYPADVHYDKIFLEIVPKHKENAIISSTYAHPYLLFRGDSGPKLLITLRRCAFPFHTSPGVSDLQNSIWSIIYCKLNRQNNTIV